MPEDNKNSTVPLKDLIALKQILKDKEKKWDTEKAQFNSRIVQLQNEVKIAKADGENSDEVELVKKHLLEQAEQVTKDRSKLDDDLNSYKLKEREFRARDIASTLKSKGVEITVESLLNEEDMDSKSKDLLVEHLAKENESLKKAPSSPESVFESGSGGVVKKQVRDMDDKEFAAYEKQLTQAALLKK